MSTSDHAMKRWRQTMDELRACRSNRTELWGDVDDITLASYIDSRCSEDERRLVEEALDKKPAVRELVDFLRNVVRPVWIQQPAGEVAAFAALRESDAAVSPRRSVLCERLRVWLDEAGQLMADGVELLMGQAGPLTVPVRTRGSIRPASQDFAAETPSKGESEPQEYCWHLPVEELRYRLSIGFKRVAAADRWLVRCGIFSQVDPRIAERARFEIARPNGVPVVQASLARLAGENVEVTSGQWEVTIAVGDDVRVMPVELGSPPS